MAVYNVTFEFIKTVEADSEDEAYEIASELLGYGNTSEWDNVNIEEQD